MKTRLLNSIYKKHGPLKINQFKSLTLSVCFSTGVRRKVLLKKGTFHSLGVRVERYERERSSLATEESNLPDKTNYPTGSVIYYREYHVTLIFSFVFRLHQAL